MNNVGLPRIALKDAGFSFIIVTKVMPILYGVQKEMLQLRILLQTFWNHGFHSCWTMKNEFIESRGSFGHQLMALGHHPYPGGREIQLISAGNLNFRISFIAIGKQET
jgi:hypothetical protein